MSEDLKRLLFGDVSTPGLLHRLGDIEAALDELQESMVERGAHVCGQFAEGPMRNVPEVPMQVYRAACRTDAYHASLN